ncbi:hypothetical protein IEQ34_020947 [Dendrobium chrysotoxum]|uniref:Uncharacterized protein n=1 Tax=Dendrobium chrysotoxum TaxID=161865 RepID=A0AAV7FKS0_DENCH|nr:hypothetical protein IEQ34_020947 [Dendrobium chrysotoxum]
MQQKIRVQVEGVTPSQASDDFPSGFDGDEIENRACLPPPGYLTISESSLRVGLRFPPPLELIDISVRCGVSLAQFSHRAMLVTMGLIAFFRDRGAILTPEYVLRMGRFIIDTQGPITFRSK